MVNILPVRILNKIIITIKYYLVKEKSKYFNYWIFSYIFIY